MAAFLKAKWEFGLEGGVVIGNPPEADKALAREAIEGAIDDALAAAKQQNILGRDVTPFLLERVTKLTEGKSLEANIALVRNNARLGAKIAVAMARSEAHTSELQSHQDIVCRRLQTAKKDAA